jgi:hypothetical protein
MKPLDDNKPIPYRLSDRADYIPLRWRDRIPFRLTPKAFRALWVKKIVEYHRAKGTVFYADTDGIGHL